MSDGLAGLWGFAGAILSPLVALIVGIVSRSEIQRKVEVYDLKLKQLNVIKKIVDIRNSFPEKEKETYDYTSLNDHLNRIVLSVSDTIERSDAQPKTFLSEYQRRPLIWRLLTVPKHYSRKGKIYEWVYYWLLLFTIVGMLGFIGDYINSEGVRFDKMTLLAIVLQIAMLLVFRKMAINAAKAEATAG